MEKTFELIDKMIYDKLTKLKKEEDAEAKKELQKDLDILIRHRSDLTNIKVKEHEDERAKAKSNADEIRLTFEIETKKKELELNERKVNNDEVRRVSENDLEKWKIVSMIVTGAAGLIGAGVGIAKLGMQNSWINKGVEFEKTGTWSTKTISNTFNSAIKV